MTVSDNTSNDRAMPLPRLQTALSPLSLLYGAAAGCRRKLYAAGFLSAKRLPCPVISIGNITTGGTGKTPMTIYLARMLAASGRSPLILSRGYKGDATRAGGLVSDGRDILMDADRSGDEPLLMAQRLTGVPIAVGKDRFQTATEMIERFSPDVILLDDGFQHFQLARDIDIVLLDNARPLGNTRLLPAGPLREPLSAINTADVIVFTRADNPRKPGTQYLERHISEKPQFEAIHLPFIAAWLAAGKASLPDDRLPDIDVLARHRAFVFSALADNHSFLDGIGRLTAAITGYRFFPDHHAYSVGDLTAIFQAAQSLKADLIITSAKDYVKFRQRSIPDFPCDLVVLDAAISFKDQAERFDDLIRTRLNNICPSSTGRD